MSVLLNIREAIEDAGHLEIPRLERYLSAMATCANIAPLLGLLGTVAGMIKAFAQIQALEGQVSPSDLAEGIGNALVTTAAGLTVAKHGNRAVSSGCGSADVLEALGVNISADQEIVEECVQQIGIGFLFAPKLHGAMKYAIGPRREIGIRTIFNMLGPLTNPESRAMKDMSLREVLVMAPIMLVVLWIGLYPKFFFLLINPTVEKLVSGLTAGVH